MTGAVVIDSNVLALIAIGTTSKEYIVSHKNTKDVFDAYDFDLIGLLVNEFSDILTAAHIIAETSSLVRQIGGPQNIEIQQVFSELISTIYEMPVQSIVGFRRAECLDFGVTDAVILHLCSMKIDGTKPTLLTIDEPLANRAHSLGYSVIDYRRDFQSR